MPQPALFFCFFFFFPWSPLLIRLMLSQTPNITMEFGFTILPYPFSFLLFPLFDDCLLRCLFVHFICDIPIVSFFFCHLYLFFPMFPPSPLFMPETALPIKLINDILEAGKGRTRNPREREPAGACLLKQNGSVCVLGLHSPYLVIFTVLYWVFFGICETSSIVTLYLDLLLFVFFFSSCIYLSLVSCYSYIMPRSS